MKNLIFFAFLLAICFSKAYCQKTQILNGNVKGIVNNKLIISQWTDEDASSTASLIVKELRHDQIAVIDDKSLIYIKDNLYVYDILNKQKKALYKVKESFELVGISLDKEKENVYVVEVKINKNLFNIVRINLKNQVSKVVASSEIDLEFVEYVEAKIVAKNDNLYIFVNSTLYDFDISFNRIKIINDAIISFAIDNENLFFFKYFERKPQLEVLSTFNGKRLILDKIGKYKIS